MRAVPEAIKYLRPTLADPSKMLFRSLPLSAFGWTNLRLRNGAPVISGLVLLARNSLERTEGDLNGIFLGSELPT